jgi:hypothetical protein
MNVRGAIIAMIEFQKLSYVNISDSSHLKLGLYRFDLRRDEFMSGYSAMPGSSMNSK